MEKVRLKKSVTSLASHMDIYLRELQKTHASLHEVHKALYPFNLLGDVGNQVVHLCRALDERTLALEFSQGEWELLHEYNAYLD